LCKAPLARLSLSRSPIPGRATEERRATQEEADLRLRVEPKMSPKFIGAFLKRGRQNAGKTQLEIAEAIGVMVQQVGRFESGKVEPMLSTIAGFAKALGGTLELEIKPTAKPKKGGGRSKA
jgi:DNA-binding XRE family transcriptional regulator